MSYESSFEAAGAVVHDSESWGSYQGDAAALVTYQGVTGFVFWSYGSCSGCDHFEATFSYSASGDYRHDEYGDLVRDEAGRLIWDPNPDYQEKLAEFGRGYLDDGLVYSYEEALKIADRHHWDPDSDQQVAWVKEAWAKWQESQA